MSAAGVQRRRGRWPQKLPWQRLQGAGRRRGVSREHRDQARGGGGRGRRPRGARLPVRLVLNRVEGQVSKGAPSLTGIIKGLMGHE